VLIRATDESQSAEARTTSASRRPFLPPPFDEQAKYLKFADDFLARTSSEQQWTKDKAQSIDTGRRINYRKSKRAA